MIIRCDNCSVSLQLDESKVPSGNFSVRCPRCQNLLRVQKDASGRGLSTVEQLAANPAAAPTGEGATDFAAKESELQINSALRTLMQALQSGTSTIASDVEENEKPRRILLCLGQHSDETARILESAMVRAGEQFVTRVPIKVDVHVAHEWCK